MYGVILYLSENADNPLLSAGLYALVTTIPLTYFASVINLGAILPVPTTPTLIILCLVVLNIVDEILGVLSRYTTLQNELR